METGPAHAPAFAVVDRGEHPSALGRRVAAEFREMPGLRITAAQASRLFSLEAVLCRGVLETLVSQGVLFADRGVFQCVGVGRRHT